MWSRRRPTSLRAVTIVSSSRGWRCTSDAHSAPANPAAPSTATRLGTQPPPDLAPEPRLDRGAAPGDVLIGQRPVVGAELEPQCERLVPGADLLAPVDVEDPDPAQQVAGRRAHDLLDRGRGHDVGDDHR